MERKLFFRVSNSNGIISCQQIFARETKLYAKVNFEPYYIVLTTKKPKNSKKEWQQLWYDGKLLNLNAFFKGHNDLMIERHSAQECIVRRATQEETILFKRRKFRNNIRENGMFYLDNEEAERLHVHEDGWYFQVVVINSVVDGSYAVVKAMYGEYTPTKAHFNSEESTHYYCKAQRGINLGLGFITKTNINASINLPTWFRDDGALIIEGRPAVCPECGKLISRYKHSLDERLCPECGGKTVVKRKLEEEMRHLLEVLNNFNNNKEEE